MTQSSVTVTPASKGLKGEIFVPGDKSISHRAVMLGSVAEGETFIHGFLKGEDTLATFKAFKSMGVEIEPPSGEIIPLLKIKGVGLNGLTEPSDVINCENSGTTARLITGLLSAQNFFSVLTGDASLRNRPMKRVVEPLRMMGADIKGRKDSTLLPLAISGRKLKGIEYPTPVASAQLKSSLLLAGLYAKGETVITEPAKSRDHTERLLRSFNVDIEVKDNAVRIKPVKQLKAQSIKVPGDISSAAFFMVGAMITPSSEILISDVGVNPTRIGIIDILQKMGGFIAIEKIQEVTVEPSSEIRVKTSKLKGINIDGSMLLPAIDEFPIICIAAAFAEGITTISGAKELRVKESDRIKEMACVLEALGIMYGVLEDGIVITGNGGKTIRRTIAPQDSKGDHRIAMSLAIAALRTENGIEILNPECADVSFPGFFEKLNAVCER